MRLWLWSVLTVSLLAQGQRNGLDFPRPDPRANDMALREIHVQLSIRGGKTRFRAGEPIRLVMSITADQPGYWVDPLRYGPLPTGVDDVSIEPDAGLFRWLAHYSQPDGIFRDVSGPRELSDRPTEIVTALNWWVRFDAEGDYTVHTSTPISSPHTRGVRIVSNPVTFHVAAATDDEEAAEARRLRALIDHPTPGSRSAAADACEDLMFLTGDIAAQAKVDLLLHPNAICPSADYGLYISRHADVVASFLERSLRENAPSVGVWFVDQVSRHRLWAEMPSREAKAQGDVVVLRRLTRERSSALLHEYAEALAEGLTDRPPDARRHIALELSKLRGPLPTAVRDVIVEQFDALSAQDQVTLAKIRAQELDAPAIVMPVLRSILARADGPSSPVNPDRAPALNAIRLFSPDEAHALLIAEILNKKSMEIPQTIRLPKPCVFSEIDRPLVAQLAELATSHDERAPQLQDVKASWLARCGTGAVQSDARRLYDDQRLSGYARAYLLAYLEKWNEAESLPLVYKAAEAPTANEILLWRLTEHFYSPGLDGLLRLRLESDDVATARNAASLLAQHGPPETRRALEARLLRWTKEWGSRPAAVEADEWENGDTSQSPLQADLILTIIVGASWKVSDAEAFALRRTCVTQNCRQIVDSR